jgi:hypothetical protein
MVRKKLRIRMSYGSIFKPIQEPRLWKRRGFIAQIEYWRHQRVRYSSLPECPPVKREGNLFSHHIIATLQLYGFAPFYDISMSNVGDMWRSPHLLSAV